jgi:hypothetical protein
VVPAGFARPAGGVRSIMTKMHSCPDEDNAASILCFLCRFCDVNLKVPGSLKIAVTKVKESGFIVNTEYGYHDKSALKFPGIFFNDTYRTVYINVYCLTWQDPAHTPEYNVVHPGRSERLKKGSL